VPLTQAKNTLENLLEELKNNPNPIDEELVQLAYVFASAAHEGQVRKSGKPYITHPLATALTLARMRLDQPTIIAGLLHDVPEETPVTLQEIKKNFGAEVAQLVEGITKLGTLKYRGIERYAENLRKMFVAMAQDIRVILIKFADRLHNLRTLEHLPKEKRERIAHETLEIYAPIANRLGIWEMQGILEDLSFKYTNPEDYEWLRTSTTHRYEQKLAYVAKLQKILEKEMLKQGMAYTIVYGRPKRLYSLYKKLLRKNKDFDKVYDLVALRIIVPAVADCYTVLGIVHGVWPPLPERLKDYIAMPKPNGYRSLHTTVFGPDGERVEVQIRTEDMNAQAEFGIAAHWVYKEKDKRQQKRELQWIQELVTWQKEIADNTEYVKKLRNIDIFSEHIFVFTPKGDVIDLPDGATVIDFAYTIHTDIGNQATGSLVNEKMVSLDTVLQDGDVIEIIRDKNRKYPNRDWLEFAKTGIARSKIRALAKPF